MMKSRAKAAVFAAAVCLLLSAGSCRTKPGQMEGSTERIVPDKEVSAAEKRFMDQIDANLKKSCPRPTLRGEPIDGVAGPAIIQVVEASPATSQCFSLLETKAEALENALFEKDPKGKESDGDWKLMRLRQVIESAYEGALVSRIVTECAPLIEAIRKAVMYKDACSPYLAGKRGYPKMITYLRSADVVSATARQLFNEGKKKEAFELLLDGLRLSQDLSRGDVSWLVSMITVRADVRTMSTLNALLNAPDPLGEELIKQIQAELSALAQTEPHPASYLVGDYQEVVLHTIMPAIEGHGWTPPGGWHSGKEPKETKKTDFDESIDAQTIGADEKDDNAIILLALEDLLRKESSACPGNSTPEQCHKELSKLMGQLSESAPVGALAWLRSLAKLVLADERKEAIRSQIVKILQSLSSATPRFIAMQGQRRFFLAALRVQAAVRLTAEQTGKCSDKKAFETQPLKGLAVDPNSRSPMTVSPSPGNKILLKAASFAGVADAGFELTILCPKPPAPAPAPPAAHAP